MWIMKEKETQDSSRAKTENTDDHGKAVRGNGAEDRARFLPISGANLHCSFSKGAHTVVFNLKLQ